MSTPEEKTEHGAQSTTHKTPHSAEASAHPPAHVTLRAPPARATPKPAHAHVVFRQGLRRVPATIDPLGRSAAGLGSPLNSFRLAAGSKVFTGLQQIHLQAGAIDKHLSRPKLPARLVGAIHQPDGSAAARVQLQFKPQSIGAKGGLTTALTADNGSFILDMPVGAESPSAGLSITVHGANQNATVTVAADQIAANGMVGVVALPTELSPLPVSIIAALQALTPINTTTSAPKSSTPKKKHAVNIGEQGSLCSQTFSTNEKTDRFPWGLFFRITEPQMSVATQAQEVSIGGKKNTWVPLYKVDSNSSSSGKFFDRIPIDQPLSVDGFRDQIAGIDGSGAITEEETVPMAASIGLGYILRMAQQWQFEGLGLGDLVYSLPLAPGEQQQVAVFERRDTSAVQESESFFQTETKSQVAQSDTSTNALFSQSFNEMVNGNSSFNTNSSSVSAGVSFGIGPIGFGGGGGSSSSSGNSSSSLVGSRDATSTAVQGTHSSAENQAAAQLNAGRTGMRLATASENMSTTTKIITNHNHTHALTVQYWEVVRLYDVSTTIEGVTLTCLIPMQIVRFMPPGQPVLLTDPGAVDSSEKVAERYKNILRHLDVLQRVVPWQFQRGLSLLARFAADPTTIVDSSSTSAETVIGIEMGGNFLPCEKISVAAVTKFNTRVGPVQLSSLVAGQPSPIPQNRFMTREELIGWLTGQRQSTATVLQGSLALPPSLNRSDIVGFEVTRQFSTVVYTLTSAAIQAAQQLLSQTLHQGGGDLFTQILNATGQSGGLIPQATVTLGPSDLEPLLGGPTLNFFAAAVEDFDKSGSDRPAPQETYAHDRLNGIVLSAQPLPIPAMQIAPILRYQDILEIEKAAQHIVRNTTRYSRALWMSLTPEETAILLDGYTIGVPPGGLDDASQMIPLLNCVQPNILGTFGNSLIMPFTIPQDLADEIGIDPGKLQQSLLDYQLETFVSPHSTIALPTRGVLGEAVLGSCPSAEKIDLTRFWNWQDAPADTAPGIGMVQLPTTTPPLTTGVTAPNSLTNLPPLINNLITAPQPNTGLLQAMGQQASAQQDFSPTLTGQQQLSTLMQNGQTLANQARAGALQTSQALAEKAMDAMAKMIGPSGSPTTATPSPAGGTAGAKGASAGGAKGPSAGGATGQAGGGAPAGAGSAGAATTQGPADAAGGLVGAEGAGAEGGASAADVIGSVAPLAALAF